MAFPRSYQAGWIMKMFWGCLVFLFLKPYLLSPANHTSVMGMPLLFISNLLRKNSSKACWRKCQAWLFEKLNCTHFHLSLFNLFTYKQNALYCIECSFDRWLLAFYSGVKKYKDKWICSLIHTLYDFHFHLKAFFGSLSTHVPLRDSSFSRWSLFCCAPNEKLPLQTLEE